MADVDAINAHLQSELRRRGMAEVRAVEAATWLDPGLLPDRADRPGAPLRDLLRAGVIVGSDQRPPRKNGDWWIVRV